MTSFTYLGVNIDRHSKSEKEVRIRVAKASNALGKLESQWKSRNISMPNKLRQMRAIVAATLLNACESWTLTTEDEERPVAFEIKAYRRLLGISWRDRITNEWVRNETTRHCSEVSSFTEIVKEQKFRCFGHVVRGGRLARQIMEGGVEGRRGRGRAMTSWIGNLKECSRNSAAELTRTTGNDRTEWRNWVRKWVNQQPLRLRN